MWWMTFWTNAIFSDSSLMNLENAHTWRLLGYFHMKL